MKQVPPEVLVQILNFLDIRELCRSAQVCTQWRDLVSYQVARSLSFPLLFCSTEFFGKIYLTKDGVLQE